MKRIAIALSALVATSTFLMPAFPSTQAICLDFTAQENSEVSTHLTIEQISKVISENKTFEDIYAEIQALQSEPDVSYGSGMSIKEYWLNDQGDDFIIIFIEQKQIFRSDRSNNRITLFDEKANGNTDTSSEDSTTVPNDSNDDANSTQLEELNRKGEILFGEFQREKAILLGEYDANSPRLTLDKAEQYISESGSYDEFYKKLSTVQAYPDFIGGSGIINIEYWFDDNGSEKLLLLEQQKDIIYVQCNEKGKITNWQLLYPVENEIKFETYKTAMIGSYLIYNDVDATGDVNADGSFNISDVVLLQKWLLAVPDTELASWKAADFSKDNKLDVFDLCLMKRALIEGMDK